MKDDRKNIIFVLLLFTSLIFIKYFFISHTTGPIIVPDEIEYKMNAEQIFNRGPLYTVHYPPLYSLLLSLAFFSREHWYAWMLFFNVLVSSFVILPVWLISIRLLPRSSALIVIFITALWPFHAAYPRMLMGENLYVPLFLLPIFFLLKADGKADKPDMPSHALFGITMALAYLTKYIYIVAVPLLLLLWWLKPLFGDFQEKKNIFEKRRVLQFLVIVAAFSATCVPWLIYAGHSFFSLKAAMGLGYKSYGTPSVATAESLILWTSLYLSYFILQLAPYLFLFSVYVFLLLSGRITQSRKETFFFVTVALLSFIFLSTAIQHSWRSRYNYPDPSRVMGRYLIQLSPLYLIVFMVTLRKIMEVTGRLGWRTIVVPLLFSLTAVLIAQGMLFRLPMWHLKFDFVNSPDGVPYEFSKFTYFMLSSMVVSGIILAFDRRNVILSRRYALFFSVFLLIILQGISSFGAYRWSLIRDRQVIHGRMLAEFLHDQIKTSDRSRVVIYDIPDAPAIYTRVLSYSLKFWLSLPEQDESVSVIPLRDYRAEKGSGTARLYFLTGNNYGPPLFSYIVRGQDVGQTPIINRWVLKRFPQLRSTNRDENYFIYDFETVSRNIAAPSIR